MDGSVGEWMSRWMDEWMGGWDAWKNGVCGMMGWTGWVDGWMNGWMGEWMEGYGWLGCMEGWDSRDEWGGRDG